MKKILLYSGGMDSWLIKQLWKPDVCLYIDMCTKYGDIEQQQLPSDVEIVKFPLGAWEREDKIIPLRNLFLCMVAANIVQDEDIQICLGATRGDRVLDKSEAFAQQATTLLSWLWQKQWWTKGRKIEIVVPFKKYTKEDMLRMYAERGGKLELAWEKSFSCYNPDEFGNECWECKPCVRKCVAFWNAGFKSMSNKVLERVWTKLDKEIIPLIEHGKYGRGKKEERGIVKAWKEMNDKLRMTEDERMLDLAKKWRVL